MAEDPSTRWYHGITGYQWLVLFLASAGWVFDVYEGQIYGITRTQMLREILPASPTRDADVKRFGDYFFAVFLVGGAVGGIVFGVLADRWGRRPMLIATILFYSVFSGLTYFVDSLWQIGVLRFLVAVGVGGEWSVAASLVAEEFPAKARAQAGGIFHASSVIGTWLAAVAGMAVGDNWRVVYLIGVAPALLVVWIRLHLRDDSPARTPDPANAPPGAGLGELWTQTRWRNRASLGFLLAAVGLATFWAVVMAGQDLTRELLQRLGENESDAQEQAKFAFGFVQTAGGGLGLLAFGPLAARWGRRAAFLFFQVGALVIVPIVCFVPATYGQLLALLPLYGFFTLGMHAGFAIYFPELFPTRLRATGAGFCFNGGRLVAASILWFSGWLKAEVDLRVAVTLLGLLFLAGVALVFVLPETKGQPLPE